LIPLSAFPAGVLLAQEENKQEIKAKAKRAHHFMTGNHDPDSRRLKSIFCVPFS
jgi:hypothetical protein